MNKSERIKIREARQELSNQIENLNFLSIEDSKALYKAFESLGEILRK